MYTNGFTITLRQQIYFEKYCTFKRPVMTQLVVLQFLLKKRKCLYLSISEMLGSGVYEYWTRRSVQLQDLLDNLARQGYVVKASRVSKQKGLTGRKICIWGLTAKGKALLKEYYAYIEGEYDHVLFGDEPVALMA